MRNRLVELALLFLRLGATAFGGPAAHIAMMENEVVARRAWLTREEFLDLLGATNVIPGPNSTEMAIHIGHRRAGWAGLIVAGVCFIVPAVVSVTLIAWAYVRFGSLPAEKGLLAGMKPVIVAIVLQALWGFGKTAIKSWLLGVVGIVAIIASALGANELVVLLGAGIFMLLARAVKKGRANLVLPLLASPSAAAPVIAVSAFGISSLFLFFLKVGAVLFGSGYVLLVFLRADLVDRWHWLTESQLLDAVAVGQFTPGPVFTTATFIGYLLGGFPSAMAATVGIFLPAFVFVALSAPIIPRLRRSQAAGAILDGVNVASLSLMALVTWFLARAAIVNARTAALAVVSAVLLIFFRINSAWLVLGGALIGLAIS